MAFQTHEFLLRLSRILQIAKIHGYLAVNILRTNDIFFIPSEDLLQAGILLFRQKQRNLGIYF